MTITTFRAIDGNDDRAHTEAVTQSGLNLHTLNSAGGAIRFRDIAIPPGSTINAVTLNMITFGTSNFSHYPSFQNADNPANFVTDTWNVNRTYFHSDAVVRLTSNHASDVAVSLTDTAAPALKSELQSVIDRPGWAEGNAVVLALFRVPGENNTCKIYSFETGGAGSHGLTVDFTPPNVPPVANAGADQAVQGNAVVTLDGSGSSDAEGAVTYDWTQTGGSSVVLSDATAESPTFTAPNENSVLTFQLEVTDDGLLTDTDTVSVTVSASGAVTVLRPSTIGTAGIIGPQMINPWGSVSGV